MKSLRALSGFLVLALIGACFGSGIASSKVSKGKLNSWDNLKSLTPGQEIRVEMTNGTSYQGEFESFNDNGITLRQSAGEQKLARKDVYCIAQLIGHDHRARNALIGAAVGASLGLTAGLTADHIIWNSIGVRRAWVAGTPAVAGFGAAIGAAIPTGKRHDIYRSPGWRHLIYRGR